MDRAGNSLVERSAHSDQPLGVIWLGAIGPLLETAWPRLDIHHVRYPNVLLQALQHGLSQCVIIDAELPDLDMPTLLGDIQQAAPNTGIILLADDPTSATSSDIDQYLPHDANPDDLVASVRFLITRAQESSRQLDYQALQQRTRHLEGLVQASVTLSSMADAIQILGDLRDMGRVAVDADDLAVLLTNEDYSDISDALGLGVPEAYLEVCREHLQAMPPEYRMIYLGDEVLLRERMPDMLPLAPRVREAAAAGAWSYMRVPMTFEQHLLGFVALFSQRPNQFDGAHLQLGRLFATQVATAVRNMRLYVRLNRVEQRQSAVSEVARLITENLTLDAVLNRIVEEAVQLIGGQAGLVLLTQPDDSQTIGAVYHMSPDHVGIRVEPDTGQAGMIAKTSQPSVIDDYPNWPQANKDMLESFPEDAVLFGVPLIYRGDVLGVLQVVRDRHVAGDEQEDQDFLMMLAPQAATAIAKAQLHETVQQDRRRLQAILEHTPAAIVVCNADGYPQLANPAARHILDQIGLSFDSLTDQRVVDVVHRLRPDEPPDLSTIHNMVEVSFGQIGEYVVHIAPITKADGTVDGYVGVAQNMTEIRRMDRMKSNLNRVLTHDLGNLLMLARSPLELLDEPDLTAEQRETLKQMLTGSLKRMETLIKDVMDLEIADSLGQESVAPYELSALVQQAVKRNREEADKHMIALDYEEHEHPPRPLMGHAVLIMQAIDNLVSNAVKYTQSGGRVSITSGIEGDYAVVRVRDTGYGIPADKLGVIFDPFVRIVDRRTRHIKGTGLGLNLVKTFVEAHGGYVNVTSTLDEGSEFAIFLPLEPEDGKRSPASVITRLEFLSPGNAEDTSSPGR